MDFEDVIGHSEVKKHLLEGLHHGRIPHAQLFAGPEGCGALPMALAYATHLLSHANSISGYSEQVNLGAQQKANNLVHPDLHFVFPINTTKDISDKSLLCDAFLEDWRKALTMNPYMGLQDWYNFIGLENKQGQISVRESEVIGQKLSLKPYEGLYKVMIIWMAERMHHATANKLLKLLEEPSGNAAIILVTEDIEAIMPTIFSRMQLVKMGPILPVDLSAFLMQRHALGEQEAAYLSRISAGSYLRCLQILQEGSAFDRDAERFKTWMRLCFSKNVAALIKFVDELAANNRETQKAFLEYALHMIRDSIVQKADSPHLLQATKEETAFLLKFAPFIHSGNIVGFMETLDEAILDIERNINSKLVLFDVSVRIMQFFKKRPISAE